MADSACFDGELVIVALFYIAEGDFQVGVLFRVFRVIGNTPVSFDSEVPGLDFQAISPSQGSVRTFVNWAQSSWAVVVASIAASSIENSFF
ncbi:hypothetical protein D3C87_1563900 [compost metagenome]